MDKKQIIAATERFVREQMQADATGHDWLHVERVRRMALRLAAHEGADPFVVGLAALLHDLDDYKITGDLSGELPRAARWLARAGVDEPTARRVLDIIARLSFKGAGVATPMADVEGCVVQDADRLDAIGAIGIARAFAYGGARGRALYDPQAAPVRHASEQEYKRNSSSTVNHFYEKLLLLKDRMNTPTARAIAQQRHRYMEEFLVQLYEETGLDPALTD